MIMHHYTKAMAALWGAAILIALILSVRASAADKLNPVREALGVTEADCEPVATFAALKTAVEAGRPVKLTADVKADGDIGAAKNCIDSDVAILGGGHTLDMGAYRFLLAGSNTLFLSDLTVESASRDGNHRYGVFCLRDGYATTTDQVWQAGLHNLTFRGPALLGTHNTEDHPRTGRYFEAARFTGDTVMDLLGTPYIAAVYVRDVEISGSFQMTGAAGPFAFKSPGTGGPDSGIGRGVFLVDNNATVSITGDVDEAMLCGYGEYRFEGAAFRADAGGAPVIRSGDASRFLVGNNGRVELETTGRTALLLRKSAVLALRVDQGAVLDIRAEGADADQRGQAPVVIAGPGSSDTAVAGTLTVTSQGGNGWHYEHTITDGAGAVFTVEPTGEVEITAGSRHAKGAAEYAAFDAGGRFDMELTVRGAMTVESGGRRGMSLADSRGFHSKRVLVTGDLTVSGVHWAIAAESQPDLNIEALEGGSIDLRTTGGVGDGYSASGDGPATVHAVGPTTFRTQGYGSRIAVTHSGGSFGAILHDGHGPLRLHATEGGVLAVSSQNSGAATWARRAAVTARNTAVGPRGSTGNEILVDGDGSALSIANENAAVHNGAGDTGRYPTGAVAFPVGGTITVSAGGSFEARSNSLAPTLHLLEGAVNLDEPGAFDIRNDSLPTTVGDNLDYATTGQAVYNERYRQGGSFQTAIAFEGCAVTVWSVLKNADGWAVFDNRWDFVSFTADNLETAITGDIGQGGDTALGKDRFHLSAYGRIAGELGTPGTVDPPPGPGPERSAPPRFEEVYEGDPDVRGEGVPWARVIVTFPDGSMDWVEVGTDGTWRIDSPVTLETGWKLYAYQEELGKLHSVETETTILPRPPMPKSETPYIEDIHEGDSFVYGTGIGGADITLTFPSGRKKNARVDGRNEWRIESEEYLEEGRILSAQQAEPGKLDSDPYMIKVLPKPYAPILISEIPAVDDIHEGDEKVSGTGIPSADIFVVFPNGTQQTDTVSSHSSWSVECDGWLDAGRSVMVYQVEQGKHKSEDVWKTIKP